jgi:hypothetical protein
MRSYAQPKRIVNQMQSMLKPKDWPAPARNPMDFAADLIHLHRSRSRAFSPTLTRGVRGKSPRIIDM